MTQVLIDVIGVHAVATKNAPLTVGMVGVPVRFSFSPEWEELECLAVFRAGEVKKDNVLIDGCSVIPAEVMTQVGQTVYIGVEGRSRDGSIVFPTVWAEAGRILDGARASGDPALMPTPSQFDRLMGEMKRVDTTLRQTWEKLFPYGESEEILPAMTAAVSSKVAQLPKIQILPGETYLVSFNGQDYTIVAEEEENTRRIGKISEGVPFSVYNSQAKPNGTWLQVEKNLAEVNVALWRRGTPAETIDPKLLPAYGTGSGGTGTQEQIASAVAAYLENHPLPKGLSDEQITALDGMFRVAAYAKEDVSQEYEAFKNAFSIHGEEEPEAPHSHSYTSSVTKAATCTAAGVRTYICSYGHSYTASIPATGHNYANGVCTVCGAADPNYKPDVPEVTLSSISATYSGGDVAEGTAVTDLTGIVVTAHYSDGSTETVTGYTLSGTIAEGSNTVTVNYGGKTATFTVTGIAEQASAWADGYLTNNGSIAQADTYMYHKEYIPISTGQTCYISNTNAKWKSRESQYAFYDADKNFLTRDTSLYGTHLFENRVLYNYNPVPTNAAYVRCSAGNMKGYEDTAVVSIDVIPELHIPFEDGKWSEGAYITTTGLIAAEAGCAASDFVSVEPNTTYKFGNTNGSWSSNWFGIGFYRADGTFISRGSSAQFTTPGDAKYVRLSATGMTGYTETATLTKVS